MQSYFAKIPDKLGIDLLSIGMLSFLKMSHTVSMTLKFYKVFLLLAILEGLHIEAANETTNQA